MTSLGRQPGPVTRYLARRLAGTVVTLVVLAAVVFILVKLIPGDEARVAAGPSASAAQVDVVRHRLGLDHSVIRQFFDFLNRVLHGNLGTSSSTNVSVAGAIGKVLPATIQVVVLALILIVAVNVPLAVFTALRAGRTSDTAVGTGVVFASALPAFWLALLAQYWLGSQLGIFPISGEISSSFAVPARTRFVLIDTLLAGNGAAFVSVIAHLFLPAAVLAVSFGAQFYRALRAELLRALDREFVTLALAKGVGTRRLTVRHVLPNAIGPAVTVLGVLLGNMVGGAILVESVFGLPGIGSYITNAVAQKDVFAVLGGVLVIGLVVVVANLAVDLVQLARDPRLRTAELAS
ncbi:MAG: Dipeptide transport system permease protein dppB [Pseudonocardiales bacterium]|nr:Dipeptide transport system permease protein dppB [Pseudonocardiales bacterium]